VGGCFLDPRRTSAHMCATAGVPSVLCAPYNSTTAKRERHEPPRFDPLSPSLFPKEGTKARINKLALQYNGAPPSNHSHLPRKPQPRHSLPPCRARASFTQWTAPTRRHPAGAASLRPQTSDPRATSEAAVGLRYSRGQRDHEAKRGERRVGRRTRENRGSPSHTAQRRGHVLVGAAKTTGCADAGRSPSAHCVVPCAFTVPWSRRPAGRKWGSQLRN
jgi:hypothetical protein